jgi:hypothetical protein
MFGSGKGRRARFDNDNDGGRGGGRVWCRICGAAVRQTRSGFGVGDVCAKPKCQNRYLDRFGD